MSKVKVYVEEHSGIDKSFQFTVNDVISMQIDYDDVNHAEVDAATRILKSIIEKNWDEKLFQSEYKKELLAIWDKNEYNLQSDYESKEDYLSQHGFDE